MPYFNFSPPKRQKEIVVVEEMDMVLLELSFKNLS